MRPFSLAKVLGTCGRRVRICLGAAAPLQPGAAAVLLRGHGPLDVLVPAARERLTPRDLLLACKHTCCSLTLQADPPPVELLHLLRGPRARDPVVALAALARPLPGGGAVDVVHVEDPAVAVHPGFPVCSGGQRTEERHREQSGVARQENTPHCCYVAAVSELLSFLEYSLQNFTSSSSDSCESCVNLHWRHREGIGSLLSLRSDHPQHQSVEERRQTE